MCRTRPTTSSTRRRKGQSAASRTRARKSTTWQCTTSNRRLRCDVAWLHPITNGCGERSSRRSNRPLTAQVLVDTRSPIPEERQAVRCRSNHHAPVGNSSPYKPAVSRILPNGKPRTGCPPGIHRLLVRALAKLDPFDEIEDEVFDSTGHTTLRLETLKKRRTREPEVMIRRRSGGTRAPFRTDRRAGVSR